MDGRFGRSGRNREWLPRSSPPAARKCVPFGRPMTPREWGVLNGDSGLSSCAPNSASGRSLETRQSTTGILVEAPRSKTTLKGSQHGYALRRKSGCKSVNGNTVRTPRPSVTKPSYSCNGRIRCLARLGSPGNPEGHSEPTARVSSGLSHPGLFPRALAATYVQQSAATKALACGQGSCVRHLHAYTPAAVTGNRAEYALAEFGPLVRDRGERAGTNGRGNRPTTPCNLSQTWRAQARQGKN